MKKDNKIYTEEVVLPNWEDYVLDIVKREGYIHFILPIQEPYEIIINRKSKWRIKREKEQEIKVQCSMCNSYCPIDSTVIFKGFCKLIVKRGGKRLCKLCILKIPEISNLIKKLPAEPHISVFDFKNDKV